MSVSHSKNQEIPFKLDPKFMFVTGILWKAIKLFFRICFKTITFIRTLILKFQGKEIPQIDIEAPSATIHEPQKFNKHESFLNYGGTRWYCQYTPAILKKQNLKNFPNGTVITFENWEGSQKKEAEVAFFGDLFEEQLVNAEDSIERIIRELKIKNLAIKEIHVIKDLGQFINKSGVPENDIKGFTLDNSNACLVHEEILLNQNLCYSFLLNVLKQEQNHTSIIAKARDTMWNQPDSILDRIITNHEFVPADPKRKFGTLRHRHVIDLDMPIADGVHLGLPAREAIVVDSKSDTLNIVFKNVVAEIRKLKEAIGLSFEEKVLEIVFKTVKKTFAHNSLQAVINLRQEHRIAVDQDLGLDFFVRHETGDAEHMALLAGYLLERIAKEHENFLCGKVSVDRNWLPGGGHNWVRYTHSAKDIYIVDPAKSFCGRLDNYSELRWPYERKADITREKVARPL